MPLDLETVGTAAATAAAATTSSEAPEEPDPAALATRIAALQQGHEQALSNISQAQKRQAEGYAKQRKKLRSATQGVIPTPPCPFQPGVFVYLDRPSDGTFSGPPQIYKVHTLNSKETTTTLTNAKGSLFNAHVSRLSLYKFAKPAKPAK